MSVYKIAALHYVMHTAQRQEFFFDEYKGLRVLFHDRYFHDILTLDLPTAPVRRRTDPNFQSLVFPGRDFLRLRGIIGRLRGDMVEGIFEIRDFRRLLREVRDRERERREARDRADDGAEDDRAEDDESEDEDEGMEDD